MHINLCDCLYDFILKIILYLFDIFLNNSVQNCNCCENETADVNVVIKYEVSDDYCDCNNIVVKMMIDVIVMPPK